MTSAYSTWLSAHGRLWYDDKLYRAAWIAWPQALAAVMVLLFWAMPPSNRNVPWAKPVDANVRYNALRTLPTAQNPTARPWRRWSETRSPAR